MNKGILLSGEIDRWPSKTEMVQVMENAGLSIIEGRYSIRIKDCEHFGFQEYGGDLGDPVIEADASSLEKMLDDASRVSAALTAAKIRHRFELYDEDDDEMVGYLHYLWSRKSE